MKVTVRPFAGPEDEVDLTDRLVAAIADELWRLYGGNERLNWLEAELHLQRIVGEARSEALTDREWSEGESDSELLEDLPPTESEEMTPRHWPAARRRSRRGARTRGVRRRGARTRLKAR